MREQPSELDECESFLQERLGVLVRDNPDPILQEIARRDFFDRLAKAIGQYLSEIPGTFALEWTGHLISMVLGPARGNSQAVRPNMPPWTKPEQEPEPAPQPEPATTTSPAAPVKKVQYLRAIPRGVEVGPEFMPGAEILAARTRKSWTQEKLGKEIGVTGAFISSLENGNAEGKKFHYVSLRSVLGLPPTGPTGMRDMPPIEPHPHKEGPTHV